MLSNRIKCEAPEVADLRAYLRSTPVSWLCNMIDAGACVSKASVESVVTVGNLETIFECLGGIRSQESVGGRRFLIKQVMDALRHPACTDARMLQTISDYQQRLVQRSLELKITLFECNDGIIVCDGNKRTVAALEQSRAENRELVLPVYVVTDPQMAT